MLEYKSVRKVLLATEDPTERKIRFMALLTSSLSKGPRRPVLTGGSAIEVYLDGMLRTGDMDVIYNVRALKGVLGRWRFALGGGLRVWANADLGLAVDMVGEEFNGSYDRVATITTDYGPATIMGIEDLILRRLASAKFWNVPTDIEQAYLLARAHGGELDWPYIDLEAARSDTGDYVSKLRSMLSAGRRGAMPAPPRSTEKKTK